MERRKYRNPPIEEAVCEFRFASGSQLGFTIPVLFYEKIKESYPGKPRSQALVEAEIDATSQSVSPSIVVRQELNKLQFPTADDRKLVAVGSDALSVHILRPYQGWEDFQPRIEQSFEAYRDVAAPEGVKRIALRYINRIVIPSQTLTLGDYFISPPQIPKEFPEMMSAFFIRTESTYDDLPIKLALTFADAEAGAGKSAFLLDLEISQSWEKPLPLDEAISHIDELKQREQTAFEALITDRARELFDAK